VPQVLVMDGAIGFSVYLAGFGLALIQVHLAVLLVLFFFFFFSIEVELRASCLLGRCTTT
jgi:hypothetical protein